MKHYKIELVVSDAYAPNEPIPTDVLAEDIEYRMGLEGLYVHGGVAVYEVTHMPSYAELTRDNIRRIVTSHIGNTFGSGDEVADDIYYDLTALDD